MKKIIILALFFPIYLSFSEGAGRIISFKEHITAKENYERFVSAVIKVESGGNPLAKGTAGDYGILQIREIRVKDYNQRTGRNYKHEDCFKPEISREIFDYYSKGKEFERAAREWNGGPAGMKKESTLKYWYAIQKISK